MGNNVPANQSAKPQKPSLPTENIPEHLVDLIEERYHLESFSGPLPSPEILSRYKELDPSFPERIFSVFEKQSAHRQELESKFADSQIKNQSRGAILTFLFGMGLVLLTAVLTIYLGWSWYSISFILGFIAAVLRAYALVNKTNQGELAEKREMVERK